jgi:hypothetical protein
MSFHTERKDMDFSKLSSAINIKGFIASLFTITTCWMFIQQLPIPPELMVINTVVIIDYFRSQENKSNVAALTGGTPAQPVAQAQEALAEPFIPEPRPR